MLNEMDSCVKFCGMLFLNMFRQNVRKGVGPPSQFELMRFSTSQFWGVCLHVPCRGEACPLT